MNHRSNDPVDADFSGDRTLCTDHENRIKVIEDSMLRVDSRQNTIYKSMYGPNGNPKEGYVWKLEKLLSWFSGFEKVMWIAVPIGMAGALAAIWQMLKMTIEHGRL